jgi:HEAT repeat protein
MSEGRWKISFLFILITLVVVSSLVLNSDKFAENGRGSGNTTVQTEASKELQIKSLMDKIKNGDNETRLNASTELGKFGESAASSLISEIEANTSSSGKINSYILLGLLKTKDKRTEAILSKSFELKENSNKTVLEQAQREGVLQAIEEKDKSTRKYLADSLNREYQDKTNILEEALKSENQDANVYTAFALSEFGSEEPGDETEKLLEALRSENGYIRISAMMALGERKEKSAIEPITGILTRDYTISQNCAAFALGEIGDEGAVDALLKQIKDSDSEQVRSNCALALGKIGEESSLPYLIDRLRDSKAGVRSSAALALGKVKEETAVEPLIQILETGKTSGGTAMDTINADPDLRKSAILALGEIGGARATETLINVITYKEERNDVKIVTASALGEIGDSRAIETLKMVVDDKNVDNRVKKAAYIALGKTKNQDVAGILLGKLGDREFRASAREALITMGEPAIAPLIENLKNKDQRLKDETALILIEIGNPKAVKPLILAYQ